MLNKMNKKYIFWGIILFSLLTFIFIFSFLINGGKNQNLKLTNYSIQLSYNEETCVLSGNEKVEYVNNYDNMFQSLYFHLYPNAFREGAKNGVVSANNVNDAYPNGYSYGKIEILGVVYENGDNAIFEICGEDRNILFVKLLEDLYPEESVVLNITFETTLANINHRLGYGENTINLGNFYPIACVYESGKGFSQSLYHSNGDPFYSECANYDVELECSSTFQVASTGALKDFSIVENKSYSKISAEKVRDFCLVLSKKFAKVERVHQDVKVNYYGYENDANLQECLNISVDALKTFENLYGKYPYSQISIVKSNFVHGGMEYPNIVLISDKIYNQSDINYVIVHEIAHQWWYGLVGNDEYNHAWMDEGLAEYSTLLFYRENQTYGEDFAELTSSAIERYKLFEEVYNRVVGHVDGRMERPLCDFATEPEYVECTYTKGVIMFNSLREIVGEKKFISTLRNYFKEFIYKNASPPDLIACFVSSCGKNVEGFFDSWLNGRVFIK